MLPYQTHTLSNGLRIIQESCPTNNVYCGILINAGTSHENPEDSGLAHFCEHVTFKGTERRKAWQIRNFLERVGGDLNAYTNKEETAYYAAVQLSDYPRAVELLVDMVFHSTYPDAELRREREVIIDEIDSYRDSPAELIYDEFEAMLFRNHPLGRDILGDAERLRTYSTTDALRFTKKYYRPSNATFFILGNVPFEKTVHLLEKATTGLTTETAEPPSQPLPTYTAEERICKHDTHQAHVLIGNRCYSRSHPLRPALLLLTNIIGGPGMNAMLSVSLREKRGLVYTVESSIFHYVGTGVWSIYFGCDEKNVDICRRLISRTLEKISSQPLSMSRLQAAKKQIIGQLMLNQDNFCSRAIALGKVYARSGQYRDINAIIAQLLKVTPDDILLAARDTFNPDNLTTLIYH